MHDMRTQTRTVIWAFVALLVGGVAGAYISNSFTARFFVDGWMLGKAVDAENQVAVLQNIRSGQIEKATELLELQLDGNIIPLGTSKDYAERTNLAVTRAVQKAKEYRSQFPRHTASEEVNKAVEHVLQSNAKP